MSVFNKILIAGPCSAESAEQVARIASALPDGVIFRAGVWKPRTSPDTFQGAGDQALSWLQTVDMPTATEVATPDHVRKALDAGIPYLWIGARTAANPIAVQAIADALAQNLHKGVRPQYVIFPQILIKNPVNEDVNLWLGNIERLEAAGANVLAIHRGCNHRPCWAMAFELRRRRPDIPLLLDPSHMSGDASLVAGLCQQAMDLDYDGLMIEVHDHPELALSDSKQQITPDMLHDILSHLTIRENTAADTELLALRHQIDEVDDEFWSLIARRMQISGQIGKYKQEHNIPILQTGRYDAILQRRLQWAAEHDISQETIQQIMDAIHRESVRIQF